MYYKTDGKPTIFAHSGFQEIVILFEIFHATLVLLFNCNHVRFHYNYVCIYVNSKYVLLILTYREVLVGFLVLVRFLMIAFNIINATYNRLGWPSHSSLCQRSSNVDPIPQLRI